MEKRRVVDINANNGDWTPIAATMPIHRIVVKESLLKADGATAVQPQGLQYRVRNDGTAAGFTQVFQIDNPVSVNDGVRIGDTPAFHGSDGPIIGSGPQPTVGEANGLAGTHMVDVRSASANATSVLIEEAF